MTLTETTNHNNYYPQHSKFFPLTVCNYCNGVVNSICILLAIIVLRDSVCWISRYWQ